MAFKASVCQGQSRAGQEEAGGYSRKFQLGDADNHYVEDSHLTSLDSQLSADLDVIFDSLIVKTKPRSIVNELKYLVIKRPKPDAALVERSEEEYREFEGKIIRDIILVKLNVFDNSVDDMLLESKSKLHQLANSLHIQSTDQTILSNVYLKSGEPVVPIDFADNERLLRRLPYLEDARIHIIPSEISPESVDVLIVVKDVWSIGTKGFFKEPHVVETMLYDKNFFGYGHEISGNVVVDIHDKKAMAHEYNYNIINILSTFISGNINYLINGEFEIRRLTLTRPFLVQHLYYAGGMELNSTTHFVLEEYPSRLIFDKFELQDAWIGRAFPVSLSKCTSRERTKFILSGRISKIQYTIRPEVNATLNRSYHSRTQILGGFSISSRTFYEGSLIYGFGRTEDIPEGYFFDINSGYEFGEFQDKIYLGLQMYRGRYLKQAGYYQWNVRAGCFFKNDIKTQGIVILGNRYFTELYSLGHCHFRSFARINYTLGFNRYEEERLSLDDLHGIRGFPVNRITGTQRFWANFETVSFIPWDLYSFKFAPFVFIDLGFIEDSLHFLSADQAFSGLGVGLRIRNEKLVFSTAQFRFSYYPRVPDHVSTYGLHFAGELAPPMDTLEGRAPSIIPFD